MVETVEASGTKEKEIGKKTDLPRSDMQGSILSRLDFIINEIRNNPQLSHHFGVDRIGKTIISELGGENYTALITDGTYLYASMDVSPGRILKIDLATFTEVSVLTLPDGEPFCYALALDEEYLYVGLDSMPAKIVKVDLATFTRVAILTLSEGSNWCRSLAQDGTYLYASMKTAPDPGRIVKIDLATFTEVATIILSAGEDTCHSLVLDGSYLYTATYTTPCKVIKIDLADFTIVSTLTLSEGSSAYYITTDGMYVYVGLYMTPYSKIAKIDIPTFTEVATLTLSNRRCRSLLIDGINMYVGLYDIPASIIRVDLATFTEASTILLSTGDNKCRFLATDGTYLYFAMFLSPGRIGRLYIYPTTSLMHRKLNKLEGHSTSPLIYTRPDRAVRIALAAGVTWAYGDYVEVIAANAITTPFKVIGVEVSDMTADKEYQIGIGTGAAASEVLKQETPVKSNVATDSKRLMFDLNTIPEIPANTRVAAKCACETDSLTCGVKLIIATKY